MGIVVQVLYCSIHEEANGQSFNIPVINPRVVQTVRIEFVVHTISFVYIRNVVYSTG